MLKFGDEERRIKYLLSVGEKFSFQNKNYTIRISDKPTCPAGEPKTDIYVHAETRTGEKAVFKISFKKENADFLENKTDLNRAKQLFGQNWVNEITSATKSIRDKFSSRYLIYKNSYRRTERGAITLGWKFELLNKKGGYLSNRMNLKREQIVDVYAGTNLSFEKRNARVGGTTICNSGVANYILINDKISSLQDIIDNLIYIEEYVDLHPNVYFACKALNYRTFVGKWDGNRPLAVYIDWDIVKNKLTPEIIFDKPLFVKGDEVGENLIRCMNQLGVRNTDELDENNVCCNDVVYM